MNKRAFITFIGGAAVAWPLGARAQQADRVRRIGVLLSVGENDPQGKGHLSGFTQALAELGWINGRNLQMEVRWGAHCRGAWSAAPARHTALAPLGDLESPGRGGRVAARSAVTVAGNRSAQTRCGKAACRD